MLLDARCRRATGAVVHALLSEQRSGEQWPCCLYEIGSTTRLAQRRERVARESHRQDGDRGILRLLRVVDGSLRAQPNVESATDRAELATYARQASHSTPMSALRFTS